MGIPSYFRKIIQKYPGIISQNAKCNILCFDFNCLIYRCIRAPGMPEPTVPNWEDYLLQEVKKTVKEVWVTAGKPGKVFIAVDGVVPMAKIRQQRVRRFKSAWLRKGGWDSNAITPGTEFMDKLTTVLEGLVKEFRWQLSSVNEEGEGEHKIMEWLRGLPNTGTVAVYGLDADLILLSMLTGKNIFLLREKQEFEKSYISDEQEYNFMNIQEFKTRLGIGEKEELLNYIGLMSLMGNDFLPHSLTHKLNDDGHDCVMSEFRLMKKTGRWLVKDGLMVPEVFLEICKRWSSDEDDRMIHMIRKKREQAIRGVGKGMDPSEGLPLGWDVEKALMNGNVLKSEWRTEYWKWIHPYADKGRVCSEYVYGFQWILDYYAGKPVDKSWMFPAWIPPLWSDLTVMPLPLQKSPAITIKPAEQLAMVLPLESWGLIRDPKLRSLPLLAPQLWPEKFSFFSAGRKWLWECESLIPVLTAERLREILK